MVKNPPANAGITGSISWVQKIPLEEGMATHSSILAWKIPWTEEPGGLQFMGLQTVGHNWATELNWTDSLYTLNKQGDNIQPDVLLSWFGISLLSHVQF